MSKSQKQPCSEFEHLAAAKDRRLIGEVVGFLRESKKWWLIPFILTLALVAFLGILGGTGIAPFIYTLF